MNLNAEELEGHCSRGGLLLPGRDNCAEWLSAEREYEGFRQLGGCREGDRCA